MEVDVKSLPVWRSASESSRFRSRPSFWPYLAVTKYSWSYLIRYKSYRVDKQTNRQIHKQTLL